MSWWHSETAGRFALEIEFNEHGSFAAHHPAIMSRVNHDNRWSRELLFAAIRVFDVNLAARQKSHVRVHAEIGAGGWFHMSRPAKSSLVDDALDPAVAGPDNIKLNAIQITMIGSFERSEQCIDVTHLLCPRQQQFRRSSRDG